MSDQTISKFLSLVSPIRNSIYDMYLFGSRCGDDWKPDSDYDVLIVLDKKNGKVIDRLYDAVMDILLDTGRLVSLKIFSLSEFNRLKSIPTPFINNVITKGINLGKDD